MLYLRSKMIVCEILRATLHQPGQFDILNRFITGTVVVVSGVAGCCYGAAMVFIGFSHAILLFRM